MRVAPPATLPTVPAPDFAQFGPIEIKPLSRVQRISGPRLHASWVNLPHVTQFDEADITQLEEARKGLKAGSDVAGVKLTPLAFIVRACVKALQKFPMFNSSLDARGENLVYKNYFHIGFAADTPQGLLVPVIRDANRKDIYEIARDVATLSQKVRSGKLLGTDMQGGSFTISSLGAIGGTAFTPIINAPEVAILGVSRSSLKPVYQDGGFVPRCDAAAVALLRSSCDRRRQWRALHELSGPGARRRPRSARGGAVSVTEVCARSRRFQDVPVIEVLVKPGDAVELDTPLITLESDKATMDVPSSAAGTVMQLLVGQGSRVSKGTPLVRLETSEQSAAAGAAAPAAPAPAPASAPPDAASLAQCRTARARCGPRRLYGRRFAPRIWAWRSPWSSAGMCWAGCA